jgi:hypothetical protein
MIWKVLPSSATRWHFGSCLHGATRCVEPGIPVNQSQEFPSDSELDRNKNIQGSRFVWMFIHSLSAPLRGPTQINLWRPSQNHKLHIRYRTRPNKTKNLPKTVKCQKRDVRRPRSTGHICPQCDAIEPSFHPICKSSSPSNCMLTVNVGIRAAFEKQFHDIKMFSICIGYFQCSAIMVTSNSITFCST